MKRGTSGLSLIVAIDKPTGMTSHDVVNRVRTVFGERRVGHTGTLDPLASGVLPVCVGPATRLDAYMVGHDKRYRVRVAFGVATDTDDCEGNPVRFGDVPSELFDPGFAARFAESLIGSSMQVPPAYSAIKINGKKACDQARDGNVIHLEPRPIQIYSACVLGSAELDRPGVLTSAQSMLQAYDTVRNMVPFGDMLPYWDMELSVSKGTYIRALARDIGNALGCPAHVASLRRVEAGGLTLDDCVTLDSLADLGERAALDPVAILGYRIIFAEGELSRLVANGGKLSARTDLFERLRPSGDAEYCACLSGVRESCCDPQDGELFSVVSENRLAAIYSFDGQRRCFVPACVFSGGVSRGVVL